MRQWAGHSCQLHASKQPQHNFLGLPFSESTDLPEPTSQEDLLRSDYSNLSQIMFCSALSKRGWEPFCFTPVPTCHFSTLQEKCKAVRDKMLFVFFFFLNKNNNNKKITHQNLNHFCRGNKDKEDLQLKISKYEKLFPPFYAALTALPNCIYLINIVIIIVCYSCLKIVQLLTVVLQNWDLAQGLAWKSLAY